MSGFTLTGGMTLTSGMTLLSGGAAPPPSNDMVLVYDLPSASDAAYIPLFGAASLTVDWGDGNIENISGSTYHTYATSGLKTVTVSGSASYFGDGQNNFWLKRVNSWGNLGWISADTGFQGAQNVEYVAQPNFTNWSGMFQGSGVISFTADLSSWDSTGVTTMARMFKNCYLFNNNISSWNTSSVTNMNEMFYIAQTFDQNISGWNVANVTSYTDFDFGTSVNWTAGEKPNFPA